MIVVISQNELILTKNHFIVKLINVVIKYLCKEINQVEIENIPFLFNVFMLNCAESSLIGLEVRYLSKDFYSKHLGQKTKTSLHSLVPIWLVLKRQYYGRRKLGVKKCYQD